MIHIRPRGMGFGYWIRHHVCPIATPVDYTCAVDHIARGRTDAARLKIQVEKGVTSTPVVVDRKEGATHLRHSKEGGGFLPEEHLPRRTVKPIAAYQEGATIDKPVCKDGLYAPICLLDIGQTVIPVNRNSLFFRGVDEGLYQLRAPHTAHRVTKRFVYVGGYVVVPEKSFIHA